MLALIKAGGRITSTHSAWNAALRVPILPLSKTARVMLMFALFCFTFSVTKPADAKSTGCFDNNRFCFELTKSSSSSLYKVSVKRQISLPVALTLYAKALYDMPTNSNALTPKAHANAFLSTNESVLLGVVKNANDFWHSMRVKWTVGEIDAKHDNNYDYLSPLQPAGKYRIVQGFNGAFSHSGASRYALDFAAPVGTPILAAREGVVIDTKDTGTKGGASARFAKYANYVVILHSDGTTGEYYHLKHKGVTVSRGQTVQRGQLIGYTGNTGFSSLPHLHFGIYVAKYHGKYFSVPFSLAD